MGLIAPDQVHLACGRVDALLRSAPDVAGWLSATEAGRLAAIARPSRREQFLAARWQARLLLAQAAGGAPQRWVLSAPADAPPEVEGHAGLQVSISHGGGWVGAVLAATAVGLDLESPRRRRDVDGLVALCCTPAEQALFAPLDAAGREALFHELWTVKESWLKRRREGLAPARLAQLEARASEQGEVRSWRFGAGWLALCAPGGASVRWWSAAPQALRRWHLTDAASRDQASLPSSARIAWMNSSTHRL